MGKLFGLGYVTGSPNRPEYDPRRGRSLIASPMQRNLVRLPNIKKVKLTGSSVTRALLIRSLWAFGRSKNKRKNQMDATLLSQIQTQNKFSKLRETLGG